MYTLICRYEDSAWGWNEKEKLLEMTEDSAWYLVAFTKEQNPIAFSHFRFDMDYGFPVLYWYIFNLTNHIINHNDSQHCVNLTATNCNWKWNAERKDLVGSCFKF